jgi:hypothetical protein
VVSDSPMWLCPMYQKLYTGENYILPAVKGRVAEAELDGIVFINFFCLRPPGW